MKLDFLALVAAAGQQDKRAAGTARSYATTSDARRLIASIQPPTLGYNFASCTGSVGCWNLTSNDLASGYKQTLDGYGAAITDTTVAVLAALPSSQLQAVFADLFGASGNQFTLMRHTIGSSDLTPEGFNYTFDDSTSPDASLAKFTLSPLGTKMLDIIVKMKTSFPAIKLLGSPWSAPGWMKLNGVQTGTTLKNNLNSAYSSAYANYLVKYIQTYGKYGVKVDAITIQNEPLNSRAGFPTMYIDQYQATDLTGKYIGPAFKSAGLTTQLWAYDHNTDVPQYPQTVLNGAGSSVSAVGWHCYAANENSDWQVLSDFHKANPSVPQYMTECWTSPTNTWYSTPDFCMAPLQNWAAGIIAWNLASNTSFGPHLNNQDACQTCRGLIVTNGDGTYTKTLDYYMMGQFSRFTKKGSIVLDTGGSYDYGGGSKFESVSFLNSDGTRTVVIQSLFGTDVQATMTFASGEVWNGLVLAKSVTTWVLPPTTGTAMGSSMSKTPTADITPYTTQNGATLINCFGDADSARSLSNKVNDVTTVEQCIMQCKNAGYTLAGVEYMHECYCDNYVSATPIDHSRCAQYACTGNITETCGGDGAIQVYQINAAGRQALSTATSTTKLSTSTSSTLKSSAKSSPTSSSSSSATFSSSSLRLTTSTARSSSSSRVPSSTSSATTTSTTTAIRQARAPLLTVTGTRSANFVHF